MGFKLFLGELVASLVVDTKGAQKGLGDAKAALGGLQGGAGGASTQLAGMAGKLNLVAAAATGVAAAVAAVAAASVAIAVKSTSAFADFEHSVMKAAAVSDLGANAYKAFASAALKASSGTEYSATQAANALQYFSMAGMGAIDAIAALPGMLNLATAGSLDLKDAADITTNILTGMRMGVEDLAHVNNVLVRTFTSSNVNLQQLGQSFKYVGPNAAAFGQDIETVAALLGKLGSAGIQADMAGTSLSMMMARMAAPMKTNSEALKRLGISLFDAKGNFVSMIDVIRDLEVAQGKLSNKAFTDQIVRAFGKEAIKTVNALLAEGSEALEQYEEQLRNGGTTAAGVAALMRSTLSSQLTIIKGNIENAGIALGQMFAPAAKVAAQGVNKLVERIMGSEQAFRTVRDAIATVIDVFGSIAKVTQYVWRAFAWVSEQMEIKLHHIKIKVNALVLGWISAAAAFYKWAHIMGDGDYTSEMRELAEIQKSMFNEIRDTPYILDRISDKWSDISDVGSDFFDGLSSGLKEAAAETRALTREQVQLDAAAEKAKKTWQPGQEGLPAEKAKAKEDDSAKKEAAALTAAQRAMAAARKAALKAAEEEHKKTTERVAELTKEIALAEKIRDLNAGRGTSDERLASSAIGAASVAALLAEIEELNAEIVASAGAGKEELRAQLTKRKLQIQEEINDAAEDGARLAMEAYEEQIQNAFRGASGIFSEVLSTLENVFSRLPREVGGLAQNLVKYTQRALSVVEAAVTSGGDPAAIASSLASAALQTVMEIEGVQLGIAGLGMRLQNAMPAEVTEKFGTMLDTIFGALHDMLDGLLESGQLMDALSGAMDWWIFWATALANSHRLANDPMNALRGALLVFQLGVAKLSLGLVESINGALQQINAILRRLRLNEITLFDGLAGTLAAERDRLSNELGSWVNDTLITSGELAARGAEERAKAELAMTKNLKDLNSELRNAPAGFKRLARLRFGAEQGQGFGQMQTRQSAATQGGNVIHINAAGMSPADLMDELMRRNFVQTGSKYTISGRKDTLPDLASVSLVG